jgi:hypothetical protein
VLDWEKLKPVVNAGVTLLPLVAGVLARSALRRREQAPDLAKETDPMPNGATARKALYRRLFQYAAHRNSRTKMLAYLFNRLNNNQLRDVLDLLDHDPECQPPEMRVPRGAEEVVRDLDGNPVLHKRRKT